jgi:uncharacterized protein (DUF58 family)
MEATDLLKKVRKIEIKTRGLSKHIFAGQYHSAFKGKGMAFSEVREYLYGDDIRNIDWNVTARFNHPYIKIFEEERELTVMLLIDVSGSRMFGTTSTIKRNVIAEISAVNNDKIGAILFSDKIEKFIPPQKGKTHILRIIRELIEFTPQSQSTNISEALRYLTNAIKKRCTTFVISDFLDFENGSENLRFKDALTIANNKHDVVGIRIFDKRETEIPPVGLVKLRDAETGEYRWVDTSSLSVRKNYSDFWNTSSTNLKGVFSKCKVDWVSISTDEDYVKPLILLFKHRG